jgi:hypothetical protein
MGEVLAAAENLEVVKEYVNSLASIKPQHKQLPQVLEVSHSALGCESGSGVPASAMTHQSLQLCSE